MKTQQEMPSFSVFGAKPDDALLVPEIPMAVRNNCQIGKWCIGDTEYGLKCSMTIIKFSKFFGDLGKTSQTLWGQLWFIAESGELPQGVVMVTYIKTQSLNDFNRLIISIQSKGIEPATGIFIPTFTKYVGNNGPYYALTWEWQERKDLKTLEQAAAVLNNPQVRSNLYDMEGTSKMICLDHSSKEEIKSLTQGHQALKSAE
jgi:hypothetical protein